MAKAKIYLDDTPGIDIMEMRAKARRLKMELGLDMIMVDYLQLMSVKGKIESRQQEISRRRCQLNPSSLDDGGPPGRLWRTG